MIQPESDPGFARDIYSEQPPSHAVPEPLPLVEFKSWHLPRKQWIRRHQWGKCAERLLRALLPLDRPLRYLGLPGTELLDIEVLAGICAGSSVSLRYLGFNTGAQSSGERTTQQLAENAVKSLDSVHKESFVVTDDILALSSPTSMAARRLKDFESFDVVNLDLCDVFTTKQGKPVHAAVKNILEFQVNGRTQPWLLFVTTVIDRAAIADEDIRQYRELLTSNARQPGEFRDSLSRLSGEPAERADPAAFPDPFDGANGTRFGRLLAVGLGKWLLSVVRQPTPWKVELKSCVGYRRGMKDVPPGGNPVAEPELFSLVFGLERVEHRLTDQTNLAPLNAGGTALDWATLESKAAVQIVKKAARSFDLDCYMQERADRVALIEEAAGMLALRNYDATKYREWAGSLPTLEC